MTIALRLTAPELAALDALAERRGESRSAVLRRGLALLVEAAGLPTPAAPPDDLKRRRRR